MAATLTQTSILARKIIRFSIYGLLALIFGRVLVSLGTQAYKVWFPAPLEPPTAGFGVLPSMDLPSQSASSSLNLTIETADGRLPTLPRLVKVYVMPKATASLLSLDVARTKATGLGFSSVGFPVSDTVYTFPNAFSPASLTMNIVSGDFSVSYDVTAKPELLTTRPPDSPDAAGLAKTFFSRAGVLPADISGPTTTQFLKADNGSLVPVVSLSQANFVKVNLFRKSFDGYSSLPTNPSEANIWLILSGSGKREDQVVSATYHYQTVNENQFETYPTKSVDQAYQDLLNGKGGIARVQGVDKSSDVTIRRIYLAYFDPPDEANYYQPIVVFEGDVGENFGGFIAYVPAITDEYYNQ